MFKWSLLMCLVKFKGPYTELSGRPELNVRHRTNTAAKRAVLCLGRVVRPSTYGDESVYLAVFQGIGQSSRGITMFWFNQLS